MHNRVSTPNRKMYTNYAEFLTDCNRLYADDIKRNEPALRTWFWTHKDEDIDFCDPSNALFCYHSNHGFDFDEMRGYRFEDYTDENGHLSSRVIYDQKPEFRLNQINSLEDLKDSKEADEWGCAFYGTDDEGVEYNFCIEDGHNYSAIYAYTLIGDEHYCYFATDFDCYGHYEIDFADPNWAKKLEEEMKAFYLEWIEMYRASFLACKDK